MKVKLHATDLVSPSHMEWTQDGRLLVSEHSAGRIKDITDGGDMINAQEFAFNLKGPAAILPLETGEILVAETWAGKVTDISSGGDMAGVAPYIEGLSNPYSLATRNDRIYVSEHYNGRNSWISDITDKKNVFRKLDNIPARPGASGQVPFEATNEWQKVASSGCIISWQSSPFSPKNGKIAHFVSVGAMGQVLDIADFSGDYIDAIKERKAVAWDLGRLGAVKMNEGDGYVYVVEPEHGTVVRFNPEEPKNMRFEPPVVRGINFPTCLRFSPDWKDMYVCSQGDGVVWKVEDF